MMTEKSHHLQFSGEKVNELASVLLLTLLVNFILKTGNVVSGKLTFIYQHTLVLLSSVDDVHIILLNPRLCHILKSLNVASSHQV